MSKAKLFQKMAKVMGKVERVPKNGFNSHFKYQYSTESDVIDSVRKFMAEEGLVLFNNVKEYEINGEVATVAIEFTLACTETGETITSTMIGQGQDRGDKAFYKSYAGATKYFLMKTFLIPTGDDPEADITTDQRNQQSQPGPSNQKSAGPSNNKADSPSMNKNKRLITEGQMEIVNQKIEEIKLLSGVSDNQVIDSLKDKMGDFGSLQNLTSVQANKVIEQLTVWKTSYENRAK